MLLRKLNRLTTLALPFLASINPLRFKISHNKPCKCSNHRIWIQQLLSQLRITKQFNKTAARHGIITQRLQQPMAKLTCNRNSSKQLWSSNTSKQSRCSNKPSCQKLPTRGLPNKMDKWAAMVISSQLALKAWWTSWRCSKTLNTDHINNNKSLKSSSNNNSNSSRLKWDRSRWIRAVKSCSMELNWFREVLQKVWRLRVTAMVYQLIKLSIPMVNNSNNKFTTIRLSNKSIKPLPTWATLRIDFYRQLSSFQTNRWVKSSSFKSPPIDLFSWKWLRLSCIHT